MREVVAFLLDFAYVAPLAFGLGLALGHGEPFGALALVLAALAVHWRRRARRFELLHQQVLDTLGEVLRHHGRSLDREEDARTTTQALLAKLAQARRHGGDDAD